MTIELCQSWINYSQREKSDRNEFAHHRTFLKDYNIPLSFRFYFKTLERTENQLSTNRIKPFSSNQHIHGYTRHVSPPVLSCPRARLLAAACTNFFLQCEVNLSICDWLNLFKGFQRISFIGKKSCDNMISTLHRLWNSRVRWQSSASITRHEISIL